MSILTTRAILLRSYPYSETSRVLRFFTAERGLLGVMAKGARRGDRRGQGTLDIFDEGELTVHFRENRDLQTMGDFSVTRSRHRLGGDVLRFAGASVLAELVLRHAGEEESRHLFEALRDGLDRIEGAAGPRTLAQILSEGWRVVSALGYAPLLDDCIVCGESLDPPAGGLDVPAEGVDSPAGGSDPPAGGLDLPAGDLDPAEGGLDVPEGRLDPSPGGEPSEQIGSFDFAAGGLRCSRCGSADPGRRVGPVARRQLRGLLAGDLPPVLLGAPQHLRLFEDFVTRHVSDGTRFDSLHFLAALSDDEAGPA